ncbi:hypothetical protein D1872_260670 [compost metagenome]
MLLLRELDLVHRSMRPKSYGDSLMLSGGDWSDSDSRLEGDREVWRGRRRGVGQEG